MATAEGSVHLVDWLVPIRRVCIIRTQVGVGTTHTQEVEDIPLHRLLFGLTHGPGIIRVTTFVTREDIIPRIPTSTTAQEGERSMWVVSEPFLSNASLVFGRARRFLMYGLEGFYCDIIDIMNSHTLKEGDWEAFVSNNIVPLCTTLDAARVFALVGELGAGKTTFSKEFIKQLGVLSHVQSPTFSIINSYDSNFAAFKKIFHVDVYRIEDMNELEVLHFEDILKSPENIVIVEWADKIKDLLPNNSTWIYFGHDTVETRKVTIQHGKN